MQLRLDVPKLAADIAEARLTEWRKAEGEPVAVNEVLCVLAIDAKVMIVRKASTLKLLDGGDADDQPTTRVRRVTGVSILVLASEAGVVRRHLLAAGRPVESGTPLAVVTSTADDPVDEAAVDDAPAFRAFVETVAEETADAPDPRPSTRVRAFRRVFGADTRVEAALRRLRTGAPRPRADEGSEVVEVVRGDRTTTTITSSSVIVRPDDEEGPPIGIFLWGGCDLPAFFDAATQAAPMVRGVLAVHAAPVALEVTQARLMLQALEGVPTEHAEEACSVLGVNELMFSPRVFDPTFRIDGPHGGEFDKALTILSLGAEAIRPVYRHREHGYLIDPGGMWLGGQIANAMNDKARRAWFKEHFEKVGRVEVDDFGDLYRRLIAELRGRTGGDVAVFNTLTVEPGDHTHNYQHRRLPEAARRRELHVELAELSAELDIPIIDVDRTLKRFRVEGQLDFAHFPEEKYSQIAAEIVDLLIDRGLIEDSTCVL